MTQPDFSDIAIPVYFSTPISPYELAALVQQMASERDGFVLEDHRETVELGISSGYPYRSVAIKRHVLDGNIPNCITEMLSSVAIVPRTWPGSGGFEILIVGDPRELTLSACRDYAAGLEAYYQKALAEGFPRLILPQQ